MDQKTNRSIREYSESFKRKVIEEHLNTGASQSSLLRKYDIRFKGAFQKWMQQLGYINIYQKVGHLQSTTLLPLSAKKKKISTSAESGQEARIKELERLLEDEQLRSEAYSRMIDIAEKEFHIPIRKKPNTK
jgi:transposase-like protein